MGATPADPGLDAALVRVGQVPGAAGPFERRTLVIVTLLVAAVSTGLAFLAVRDSVEERAGKAVGVIATAIGFLYAYLQWRAGRHEASFDKYYDRLDLANRHFNVAHLEHAKDPGSPAARHYRTMFLYAELDNLEFILGKYRLRYIREDLARRAIRHFAGRCREDWFRSAVRDIVADDAVAYERETRDVVLMLSAPPS